MIKAIETSYKGYRFRSRLEAKWAVFLDHIGWEWQYEPEGFELGDGDRYLPDFLIEDCLWLEIKAKLPTADELRKARKLADQSDKAIVFGVGLPDAYGISYGLAGFQGGMESGLDLDLIGQLASLNTYCYSKWKRPGWLLFDSPDREDFAACDAAKGARFEFGESGARP